MKSPLVLSLSRRLAASLCLMLFCVLSACAPGYIQDKNFHAEDTEFRIDEEAEIVDSEEHRDVLEVLLKYRQALVRKDFGELNLLISDDYYDNGSTTNTTRDDYGKQQLTDLFELLANHADNIQYRITVKNVEVEQTQAYVDYEYRYAYQFKVGEEESWDAGVEVNRVELKLINAQWKIVSGL